MNITIIHLFIHSFAGLHFNSFIHKLKSTEKLYISLWWSKKSEATSDKCKNAKQTKTTQTTSSQGTLRDNATMTMGSQKGQQFKNYKRFNVADAVAVAFVFCFHCSFVLYCVAVCFDCLKECMQFLVSVIYDVFQRFFFHI